MKKLSIIFLYALLSLGKLYAQDPFFSQLYYAPGYINPSLLGLSSRCFSARAITRIQNLGNGQQIRYNNFYGSTFLNSIKHGISVNYLIFNENNLSHFNRLSVAIGKKFVFQKKFGLAYGIQYSSNSSKNVINSYPKPKISAGINVSWSRDKSALNQMPKCIMGISVHQFETDQMTQPNGSSTLKWNFHCQGVLLQQRDSSKFQNPKWSILGELLAQSENNFFTPQIGIKIQQPSWGFVGIYFRKNQWNHLGKDALCMQFCYLPSKKSSNYRRRNDEFGGFFQFENQVEPTSPTNPNVRNSSQEAGVIFNSTECEKCFPKPFKYDRSFLGKTQKFLRKIFIGNISNKRSTDTYLFF